MPVPDCDDSAYEGTWHTHSSLGGASLPAGIICMWHGSIVSIPSGWALCDGTNGTPDLRSKFIKGASGEPGGTGGALTHTHAGHSNHVFTQPSGHSNHVVTQPADHTGVINHTHPVTDPGHAHTQAATTTATGSTSNRLGTVDTSSTAVNTGSATTGITTSNPAGGVASLTHSATAVDAHSAHSGGAVDAHSAHDSPNHEPPYYAVAFIMKT